MKLKAVYILIFFIILNYSNFLNAKEKNCFYCKKYKYLKDWPVDKRPKPFIYEKIEYPKDMFSKMTINNSKFIKKRASEIVNIRFVKAKGSLKKYQHLMIRDAAYFEAMFNETLLDKRATVESLENLKKARDALRQSLKISPNTSSSEAVYKFWATGKLMTKIYKKNRKNKKKKKILEDNEVIKRVKILEDLKKQIQTTKINAQKAAMIEAEKSINAKK